MSKHIFTYALFFGLILFFSSCSGKWVLPYQFEDEEKVKTVEQVTRVERVKTPTKCVNKIECAAYFGNKCVVW